MKKNTIRSIVWLDLITGGRCKETYAFVHYFCTKSSIGKMASSQFMSHTLALREKSKSFAVLIEPGFEVIFGLI